MRTYVVEIGGTVQEHARVTFGPFVNCLMYQASFAETTIGQIDAETMEEARMRVQMTLPRGVRVTAVYDVTPRPWWRRWWSR